MLSFFDGLRGAADPRACESTVRYVFGLIWPRACIDCACDADGFVVGVREDELRHTVRVPFELLGFNEGLALVRAVYRSGIPGTLRRANAAQAVSL
ncbi:hypothetical protein SNE35_20440 [Paucibacter sp. R3-3]|uniref:DUF2470 domain-containing protein n=1 Tax=Roseateles agri TaxID=3098619 RepID=A0ABU5DKR2_9BURK|nr:hypothetical protein [Paucibacter sp. R3-3]MDY0746893.1 hypothetical protein [Paucibacter sp. R3-3]